MFAELTVAVISYVAFALFAGLATPVSVTVCGTFQLPGVNVNTVGETVPSVGSVEAYVIVTLETGATERATLNWVAPPSGTKSVPPGVTVTPGTSFSKFNTLTLPTVAPL